MMVIVCYCESDWIRRQVWNNNIRSQKLCTETPKKETGKDDDKILITKEKTKKRWYPKRFTNNDNNNNNNIHPTDLSQNNAIASPMTTDLPYPSTACSWSPPYSSSSQPTHH